MSEQIVSKFGGTSNSTAEAVNRCIEWGADNLLIVVSAPGRLSDEQLGEYAQFTDAPTDFLASKVTDQSLAAYNTYRTSGEIPDCMLDSITARYRSIVVGLGIKVLETDWLRDIASRIRTSVQLGEDYASMLGERLQAEIYEAMGWRLLDPSRSEVILSARDPGSWRTWLQKEVNPATQYVLPGNTYSDGERLRTFSRGGSDISGALAAFAIQADVYKNMTDTPAQSAHPDLVPDDRRRMISHLTYEEGRELGRNGTGLLHPEAIVPLMGSGIPTEIRNTFNPEGPYTLYTDEVDNESRIGQVMAISLIPDVSVIAVHEPGMSESAGRVAALASHLAEDGLNAIDVVSYGSDRQLFIVDGKDRDKVERKLTDATTRNGTITAEDCSLVTLVGYKLGRSAVGIRVHLTIDAGLGKEYLHSDPYWLEGKHSLRFTASKDAAADVVDRAHWCLIEQHPNNLRAEI